MTFQGDILAKFVGASGERGDAMDTQEARRERSRYNMSGGPGDLAGGGEVNIREREGGRLPANPSSCDKIASRGGEEQEYTVHTPSVTVTQQGAYHFQ